MLYIAICDSNQEHVREIEKCLVAILFDKCDFEIKSYTDSTELVPDIVNKKYEYDLIVTEQNVKPFSGIDIAKILSKNKVHTEIIFLTEDITFVLDGYKYRLFDYLIKPVSFLEFKKTINRYLEYNSSHYEHFMYKARNKMHKVRLEDIVYFESDGRKINIVTVNGIEEFYDKLGNVEKELKVPFFVRTHQSFLVNLHYIKNIINSEVELDNMTILPISRGKVNDVRDRFLDYLSEECFDIT